MLIYVGMFGYCLARQHITKRTKLASVQKDAGQRYIAKRFITCHASCCSKGAQPPLPDFASDTELFATAQKHIGLAAIIYFIIFHLNLPKKFMISSIDSIDWSSIDSIWRATGAGPGNARNRPCGPDLGGVFFHGRFKSCLKMTDIFLICIFPQR